MVYQSRGGDAKNYDRTVFRPTPQGPITRLRMASTFLGRPVYAVSAYAFADLLIDTGPPQRAGQLVEWCRGSAVRRVVLTHRHEDHVGGAAALREELGEQARELRDGGLSLEDIARRLLGREGLLVWFSLGDFSQKNLIRGLLTDSPGS